MSDPFNRDPSAVYGAVERLGPMVRRLTVKNPSPMTFTGTHTYLVGEGRVGVIDPGPRSADHTAAILDALGPGERIDKILVTHTHVDHSPGVAALKAATGAETFAFGAHGAAMSPAMLELAASGADLGGGEGADRAFRPDRLLGHGEDVRLGDLTLTALHTPGHLSNHLAFAGPDGAVFTGDLVMGWATTLISPPDGDMAAFMASLTMMAGRGDRVYYPGHGHPVDNTQGMIEHQLSHRRSRAAQILAALEATGPATPAELTREIYTDVDPALHGAAMRNVFATLLGLIADGSCRFDGALSPEARFGLA